jgi:hypothetical protein
MQFIDFYRENAFKKGIKKWYKVCIYLNKFFKIMKKIVLIGLVAFIIVAFTTINEFKPITKKSFKTGEVLEYRLHYGFINAGYGKIEVYPEINTVNNRPCYKVNILGRSSTSLDPFYKIRDNWGSYIDTTYLLPHKAYKVVQENNYRHTEAIIFDQYANKAKTIVYGNDGINTEYEHKIPDNVQDMVSGYYYIRHIDFNKLSVGDLISINGFLDKENYDFKIRYMGKERIKTDFGKVNAIKLVPVMPKNQLFSGEESLKLWISDDKNRIPLKARAEMYVGGVEVELIKFSGLKHPTEMKN